MVQRGFVVGYTIFSIYISDLQDDLASKHIEFRGFHQHFVCVNFGLWDTYEGKLLIAPLYYTIDKHRYDNVA